VARAAVVTSRAMPEPAVSIVVPTHNRPRRLQQLLAALSDQDAPAGSFEVIVVDDGSQPPAQVGSQGGPLEPRWIRNERALGPAAARNAGWRAARAPLVGFTDDDCKPVASWVSAALEAHRGAPGAIVQGPTEPDPAEQQEISIFSHTVVQQQLGPNFETCNIFYPREMLESLGGFDETFGPGSAGEDTDLAWRALSRGGEAVFAADARVFHAVDQLGALGKLRMARRWTPCVRVLADHPQTRVMLQRRVFWNTWHYLLWRSALALLAPLWLRRIILSRYLLQLQARGRSLGTGSWSLTFFLVHDLLETWAVLRGAVKYRTLVL
jgi:GT2 family glycosyltransferase